MSEPESTRRATLKIIFRQVRALEDYTKNIEEDLKEIHRTINAAKKNLHVALRRDDP